MTHLILLSFLFLSACGSVLVLESKSAAVPAGVDLTGLWRVREDSRTTRVSATDGVQGGRIPVTRSQRLHESRRQGSSSGVSAHVFIEYGETLKITQTDYGVFISYDRAVVEEFTFGENRLVTIGPIEAKRVSGWEGDSFVVETLDDSGTTLFEAWHLEKDDTVLVRSIRLSKSDTDSFVRKQVFDRQQ